MWRAGVARFGRRLTEFVVRLLGFELITFGSHRRSVMSYSVYLPMIKCIYLAYALYARRRRLLQRKGGDRAQRISRLPFRPLQHLSNRDPRPRPVTTGQMAVGPKRRSPIPPMTAWPPHWSRNRGYARRTWCCHLCGSRGVVPQPAPATIQPPTTIIAAPPIGSH